MIDDHIAMLAARHRQQGAVVDANLLTLLIIGSVDPRMIQSARPTRNRSFTAAHFEYLDELLACVDKVLVTPHVLAETYNLLDQVKGLNRESVMMEFLDAIRSMIEAPVPVTEVISLPCFFELGVTDGALIELAQKGHLIVTVDAPLAVELERCELGVVNLQRCCPL